MMSGIRGKDTRPELAVRKALFGRGIRYRLGGRGLPGKPDLVLKKYHAVVFINGCFWHGHGCHLFKWPSSNPEFWKAKIGSNVRRDAINTEACLKLGYRVAVVWECSIKGKYRLPFDQVIQQLSDWLDGRDPGIEICGKGTSLTSS
jgi:DNA mismatch endonuclease, patch repair protein